MKKLYELFVDYGRNGKIEGLFIADESDVAATIGKEVYLGEALGKHSKVWFELAEYMLEVKTDSQDAINIIEELLGTSISGFNPFDYIEDDEEDV